MDTLSGHYNVAPEVLVEMEKNNHKKRGRDVSDEYAQDELIARACEDMLSGNKTANEIIEQMDEETAKTFSEKFKEVVAKIREWLKDLLGVYKSDSEEAKLLRRYDDKLAELQKAWDEALDKAVKANQAMQKETARPERMAASEQSNDSDRNLYLAEEDIPGYLKAGNRRNINRTKWHEAGEKIIISSEAELREFVSKSISGEITGKTVAYGKVSKKLADAVYRESEGKVDINGYYLELVADDINHSFNEHHEAKKDDNLPLSEDDYVDAILRVNSSKLVKVEFHKDNSKAIKLRLEGVDGDTMLIEVVSVSAGSIKLKTVWKEIKRNSANAAGNKNSNPNSKLGSARDTSVSKDSIPHNSENIKENVQNSDRDSAGNGLTPEQVEFFKESKVRDENGNLKPVYHGTNKEFTRFESVDGTYWFSEYVDYAEAMAEERKGSRIIEVYLDIRNPYKTQLPPNQFSDPNSEKGIIRYAKENGYDGVIIKNDTDSDLAKDTFYVAFSPAQIKAVENRNPTTDSDIRYSDRTNIDLAEELASYNLEGKWNDYIGVQKNVIRTLRKERFFDKNEVTNGASGMVVRITAKGIRETLGNGKRFQTLPRELKELKVATIRSLPDIIREGALVRDNVENIHGDKDMFAYVSSEAIIDGKTYGVRVSIRKKEDSNVFWIHNIDCSDTNEKSLELLNLHTRKHGINETQDSGDIVTQNGADVNIQFADRQTESIYDAVGELNRIQRENEKMKADVERLRKKNRLEGGEAGVSESRLDSIAGYILKKAESDFGKQEFAEELGLIYKYLQSENVEWDTFMSYAWLVFTMQRCVIIFIYILLNCSFYPTLLKKVAFFLKV